MSDQPKHNIGLFVRIPAEQARRLDRAAFALGRAKQDIVSSLLERHVDPDSPQALADLDAPRQRRITVESIDSGGLVVGHASAIPPIPPENGVGEEPRPAGDVLTLQDAAALLRVEPEVVEAMAREGALPGRRLGEQWRFHRQALLEWLAAPPAQGPARPSPTSRRGSAGGGE